MKKIKHNLVWQEIIEIAFMVVFAITPIIFTTLNYELFEFNKMIFVYLLTIIIALAWVAKMITQQKIIFQKTPLFWPLIIFLVSQIITTVTSINPHTSFFGYYTRQNGGLLSIIAYTILYFALVSNIDQKTSHKYLKVSLFSLTAVSVYAILQKLGVDDQIWSQDVKARVFSTLGQPNWLAAWINGLIFLSLSLWLTKYEAKIFSLPLAIFGLSFTSLLFTRSRSGFVAFVVSYLLLWLIPLISKKLNAKYKKGLITIGLLSVVLTIIFLSPFEKINQYFLFLSPTNPQSLPQWSDNQETAPDLGSNTSDIRRVVWSGALKIFQNHPLVGTGPETFAYSYYWYQPQAHNLLSEWDFLYNKAHNEYLNYLATTGLVGFIPYCGLIIASLIFLYRSWQKKPKTNNAYFVLAILVGYISILITNFFGFSVVCTNLLFFLLPGLVFCFTQKSDKLTSLTPLSFYQKINLVIAILVALNLIFFLSRYWLADYYFAKAENQAQEANYAQSYLDYERAHQLNKQEPFYTNKMATVSAYLALLFQQNDNNQQALEMVTQADLLARQTINLNPYQVDFYRQQFQTYYLLGQIDSAYLDQAQEVLLTAHELAPVNPRITYNLSALAFQENDLPLAITWLEKTINLKNNYQDAYYWLAKAYQENGQIDQAKLTLEQLLTINPDHEDGQALLEEIIN